MQLEPKEEEEVDELRQATDTTATTHAAGVDDGMDEDTEGKAAAAAATLMQASTSIMTQPAPS